ncbi:MAG: sigma-70 family RNA polymerase sigma factor [Deltaproteobacteria bacterium]|nr:sigma-70 family RNA polymerase sigma factor [Deltaproteobacteria bacterium]MCB9787192.1 sigma-70 family RNA polymerase sigma factor [Deltaproteobacteria bacterium]
MAWFRRRTAAPDDAFVERVLAHGDALYRYAVRLTGDEDSAGDLVQEALARAVEAFGRLRPDTNHRAWIFTILRNAWISRLRRSGREAELAEPELLADEDAPDPAEGLVRASDGYRHGFEDQVLRALARLPETQRSAILLCDVEGMRYEEIAVVMGCPVGTVRSRIHHARRQLRGWLEEYARERGYGGSDVAM